MWLTIVPSVTNIKKEKVGPSNKELSTSLSSFIRQKFCSTRDCLDQVLDYLDGDLKATVEPPKKAKGGQLSGDAPIEVDRMQSTVTELSNLGDRGGSDTTHLFWIEDEGLNEVRMEDVEIQEVLPNSIGLNF